MAQLGRPMEGDKWQLSICGRPLSGKGKRWGRVARGRMLSSVRPLMRQEDSRRPVWEFADRSRKLLQRKLLDVESDLRGTLRNFGLKVGVVGGSRYEARVRELVEGFPRLAAIVEPLLSVRRVMRQQLAVLHKMLLDTVRGDPVCRRDLPILLIPS